MSKPEGRIPEGRKKAEVRKPTLRIFVGNFVENFVEFAQFPTKFPTKVRESRFWDKLQLAR